MKPVKIHHGNKQPDGIDIVVELELSEEDKKNIIEGKPMRMTLVLKAVDRSKGDTYDGKRHDIIQFESEINGKYAGVYRYSAPVTLYEELSKLGEVVGGYDGHYTDSTLNKVPIKVSAEIKELCGIKWIHNPRIISSKS